MNAFRDARIRASFMPQLTMATRVTRSSTRAASQVVAPSAPPETDSRGRKRKAQAGARSKSQTVADPNATHATILSPVTFGIVRPSTTTETRSPSYVTADDEILIMAHRHLISVDPRMKLLINNHHCHIFSAKGLGEHIDPFESLVNSMISQLISGAAAKTIKGRFIKLFADQEDASDIRFPSPSAVAASSVEQLRTAGLSQRKAEWIKGLAEKFISGEISARMMADMPYEELFKTLLAVPGLGAWSVEMFSLFALKRLDVFSVGDLGVQRGMAVFIGRDVEKLKNKSGKWKYMSQQEMKDISAKFAPYRSVFMWYMWRILKTDVSTMES